MSDRKWTDRVYSDFSEPLSHRDARALASWWNCHDDAHVYAIRKVGARQWIVYRWLVRGGA